MNTLRTVTPLRSPCVNVCEMDQTTGLCKGCLCTQNERDWWVAYSDAQQREVLERCRQRGLALATGKGELAPCMGTIESRRKA